MFKCAAWEKQKEHLPQEKKMTKIFLFLLRKLLRVTAENSGRRGLQPCHHQTLYGQVGMAIAHLSEAGSKANEKVSEMSQAKCLPALAWQV